MRMLATGLPHSWESVAACVLDMLDRSGRHFMLLCCRSVLRSLRSSLDQQVYFPCVLTVQQRSGSWTTCLIECSPGARCVHWLLTAVC
jgi:hypothetical protein